MTREYEVALSFAGEDRAYVERVADQLRRHQVAIFYDQYAMVDAWGVDLYTFLDDVYRTKTRFVVAFISQHYISKPWTQHERQSAQARALVEDGPFFLPVQLDGSKLPGLRPAVSYFDARRLGLDQLVALILQKLGRLPDPLEPPAPVFEVPRNPEDQGQLIHQQPPGWEYLLYAGVLAQGKQALEPRWRDHELGYVRPSGPALTDDQATAFIHAAFTEAASLTGNVERVFNPRSQEAAFGRPGAAGDAARIEHLGQRLLTIYEDFLDWAAQVRGTQVPEHLQRLSDLAAAYLDAPLMQIREFIDRCVAEIERIPALLSEPSDDPIQIELTLELATDPGVKAEFDRELRRARRNRRR